MGEFTDKAKDTVNKVVGKAKQSSDSSSVRNDGAAQETKGDIQKVKGDVKGIMNKL